MKPHCKYDRKAKHWFCEYKGVTGFGETPMGAFRDMQRVYMMVMRRTTGRAARQKRNG